MEDKIMKKCNICNMDRFEKDLRQYLRYDNKIEEVLDIKCINCGNLIYGYCRTVEELQQ